MTLNFCGPQSRHRGCEENSDLIWVLKGFKEREAKANLLLGEELPFCANLRPGQVTPFRLCPSPIISLMGLLLTPAAKCSSVHARVLGYIPGCE